MIKYLPNGKKVIHLCRLCCIHTTNWEKHCNTKRHKKEIAKWPYAKEIVNSSWISKETPGFQFIPKKDNKELKKLCK